MGKKMKFALGFGNRSFFPPKYMAQAREELPEALAKLGHKGVMKPVEGDDLGAVGEEPQGRAWANWLEKDAGSIDGIIWCNPNFGDEAGMRPALYSAGKSGKPILIHGYPDTMDKLDWTERRDAFCGTMSTMDVLNQFGVPFVKLSPHVVDPTSDAFAENINLYARICAGEAKDPYKPIDFVPNTSGANTLDGITLLAIGARTSPFQTCRYDELVAAKNGINIQTQDLASIFHQMEKLPNDSKLQAKMGELGQYTCWTKALEKDPYSLEKQARFAVVMDGYIEKYQPAATGIRCWTEFQEILHMSPCATLSYLNHGRKDGNVIPAACEVDLGNALTMYVMMQNGSNMVACQDWNNNYPGDDNKFMFMHCGPHDTNWLNPQAKLRDGYKGHYVETQAILDNVFTPPTMGCIQGRFKPQDVTIGSCTIGPGDIYFFFTEGKVTNDVIPPEYFGSAGVVEVLGLQEALIQIGHQGFKHHFSMSDGHHADKCIAALRQHEGYKVMDLRPKA